VTDRDTFAAAALTGLLAQGDDGSFSEESYVRSAYRWADAMLREREQTKEKDASFSCTNHDAAPAATARTDADRARTDKAATRPGEGTGDIPDSRTRLSEAEIDAIERVVEDGRIASMSIYGVMRSLLVRVRPEWEAKP
jgi:hypothetical protein